MTAEQLIKTFRSDLRTLTAIVNSIQTKDFEEVEAVHRTINAMRDDLDMFELESQPAMEEIPADVRLPEAA